MWQLYDALIEGIPENEPVDEVLCNRYGAQVRSKGNLGFSEFRDRRDSRPRQDQEVLTGKKLRELAENVKSWNLTEAAIGVAALNAWYNSPAMAKQNGLILTARKNAEDRSADPFIAHQSAARGKKVVVYGHFPYMEKLLKPVCDLYIVNHYPEKGDYPETALEYLIPDSDYVFLSAKAFLEKSLPHLLKLAGDAYVGLVGPVTVMSPILFDYGVDELDGFIPRDPDWLDRIQKGQEDTRIYRTGEKVSLKKTEYREFLRKSSEKQIEWS